MVLLFKLKKKLILKFKKFIFFFSNFSIIIGGSIWLYRKICQYQTEVLYSGLAMEEIEREETDILKSEAPQVQDFYTLVTSLALLSIILAYFYLCDRYVEKKEYYYKYQY